MSNFINDPGVSLVEDFLNVIQMKQDEWMQKNTYNEFWDAHCLLATPPPMWEVYTGCIYVCSVYRNVTGCSNKSYFLPRSTDIFVAEEEVVWGFFFFCGGELTNIFFSTAAS